MTSWPGLSRPSTSLLSLSTQGVDARHEAGHDVSLLSAQKGASMKRRDVVLGGAAALLAGAAGNLRVVPAHAQAAYPDKPVRIVVDSAVGSANDFTARTLADKLGKLWGQQVVIFNQPGAGGGISARVAAS